jgi:hypothetical protein
VWKQKNASIVKWPIQSCTTVTGAENRTRKIFVLGGFGESLSFAEQLFRNINFVHGLFI